MPLPDHTHDTQVRSAAFAWLAEQVALHGELLPRSILAEGFIYKGERVPLVGPQGIFKPRVLSDAPLSITTSPESRYNDAVGPDGLLRYSYRGDDRDHPDNRGLRNARDNGLPLIYFFGVARNRYVAAWPVYIVGDNPARLSFSVAVDDAMHLEKSLQAASDYLAADDAGIGRRAYITGLTRIRLHQHAFRERVLEAYRRQCAFCRLRHDELLDAAHIMPDSEPEGESIVANGLALCNLHHKAFDKYFLGLRPDYIVEVRADILGESDGPTLKHAIQGLHGTRILLPGREALRPDPELVLKRYERFLKSRESA